MGHRMFKLSFLLAALLMVLTTQVHAGMVTLPDGSIYVGELQGSVPNGFGTVYVDDAEAYTGDWLLGKKSGFGREITSSGFSYLGDFEDGLRHGFGRVSDGAGFIYIGGFRQGRFHGFGKYEHSHKKNETNGYEGGWYEHEMHGTGKLTNSEWVGPIWTQHQNGTRKIFSEIFRNFPKQLDRDNLLQQSKALTEKEILLNEKPELIALTRQSEPSSSTQFNASGSGFFVNQSGYVLTNNHVIEGCSKIDLRLSNKELVEAKLISSDRLNDLALLKTAAQSSVALPLRRTTLPYWRTFTLQVFPLEIL